MLTVDFRINSEQLNKIEQSLYLVESQVKSFEVIMSKLEAAISSLQAIVEKEIEEGQLAKKKIEELTRANGELQDTVATLGDAVEQLKSELADAQSAEDVDSAVNQIEAISEKIANIIE